MKRFKKIMRLVGLFLLIVLASTGMGIIGGAPIPPPLRKEDTIEMIEEVDESDENKNGSDRR